MQFRTHPPHRAGQDDLRDGRARFRDQLREVLPSASHLLARRLHDALRSALRAGAFGDGRLPAEPELMAEFHASRDVVREALDLLRRAGLIERRRGMGTVPIRSEYVVRGALSPVGRSLRRASCGGADRAATAALGMDSGPGGDQRSTLRGEPRR
ncbi:GntR family transcriptional regulator [Nocardia sp. NPDC059229]|uniref:GntR family transcriptional regulator n=1 Tax=Nocardia sp. NPDC059229 TaxID=3346778 RepID=UPI0036C3AA1F